VSTENDQPSTILVLEDVEETRDGIEALLKADGYHVVPARSEAEAIGQAQREPPSLILVSLWGTEAAVIAAAARVRASAALSKSVPIVIFCSPTLAEGAEAEISPNVYLIRPDNFDQLRALLRRLLPDQPAIQGRIGRQGETGGPVHP
jgi:two-component system nitrogen regulation response regulator NtrX